MTTTKYFLGTQDDAAECTRRAYISAALKAGHSSDVVFNSSGELQLAYWSSTNGRSGFTRTGLQRPSPGSPS